ncbi:hypothetical protein MKJ04_15925 [Pontibacter sp. E15-1]|uniref:hypothetical protein n=1 Tax=Pontibacter sp. E15-1 TaxID=2919918 RepID=UPI001F4FEA0B|nr:hypothetical protein [Pontibacter sp. E15-1]MCJ8166337.1 hypothetical protein [Pontibacter sp. E15-1]
MKLLLVAELNETNTFIDDIYNVLSKDAECDTGVDKFWNSSYNYDIIHIHWPENLFNWLEPTKTQLVLLKHRLKYWYSKSKIIVTRHNYYPHYKKTLKFLELYEIVYSSARAIIHLGNFSKHEYLIRYKALAFTNKQIHYIIPHQVYSKLPNTFTQKEARRKLSIPQNKKVILVFGSLRSSEELNIVLRSFKSLKIRDKFLVANAWPSQEQFKRIRIDLKLINFLKTAFLSKDQYMLYNKKVNSNELQSLFKASNLVLIPRKESLNSGNLALGFTYGKVVVGPNSGNIGEILINSGNPVYNNFNNKDVSIALEQGLLADQQGLGEENLKYGLTNWNLDLIVQLHLKAYSFLLSI